MSEPTPDTPAPVDAPDASARPGPAAQSPSAAPSRSPSSRPVNDSAWSTLRASLAPRLTRGQLIAAVLCALLGFGVVAQVRQTNSDDLGALSQEELIQLFDEVTQRSDALEEQAAALRIQRAELATGADSERAALAAASQRAEVQGILAGTLPAQGPGVRVVVAESGDRISAVLLVNLIEELRNAGAEAIQVADRRVTASSYVVDTRRGVMVDGVMLEAPYVWLAIGDPDTLIPALQVPGGALSSLQARADATTQVQAVDHVTISALRDVGSPRYATPAPSPSPSGD